MEDIECGICQGLQCVQFEELSRDMEMFFLVSVVATQYCYLRKGIEMS